MVSTLIVARWTPVARRRPADARSASSRYARGYRCRFDSEKSSVAAAEVVEEIEGLAVRFPEGGGDPHHRAGLGPGGVGDELTEGAVIRGGQLFFDHQHTPVGEVSADQAERERPDRMLRRRQLKVDSQHVG